jgi:acyl carrier protein
MDRSAIDSIVRTAVQNQLDLDDSTVEVDDRTTLLGTDAVIDSLGLVNVVIEIEQVLLDDHDVTVILVDEKAMSQRNSPFRDVAALVGYTHELVSESVPTT